MYKKPYVVLKECGLGKIGSVIFLPITEADVHLKEGDILCPGSDSPFKEVYKGSNQLKQPGAAGLPFNYETK